MAIPPPPGPTLEWMNMPDSTPGVPPGLEYLTQLDGLYVEQDVSLLEVFTDWERNNKYRIMNKQKQQCYYAIEDSGTCMRLCCENERGFTFKILDNNQQEVMRITRDFKCCSGCCWCSGMCDHCAYELKIEAPVGQVIGYVKQGGSCWKANYLIQDEFHETKLEIAGPCCIWDGLCCPCDNEFKVMTLGKESQIGSVKKVYGGFREAVSNADKFEIDFPIDLSAKVKASLLAVLLMIDFMYFEKKND